MKIKHNTLLCIASIVIGCSLHSADTATNYFPQDEYEHYMQLIKALNVGIYNKFRHCENTFGQPCIEKSVTNKPAIEYDPDYPIMSLPSIQHMPEKDQKKVLVNLIKKYNETRSILPITKTERKTILKGIRQIAPELYAAITKQDPTGQHHIKRSYDSEFAVGVSRDDGLPVILVDQESLILLSPEEVVAAIAHELGHYVSKDFLSHYEPSRTFKPTKRLTCAYERMQEYEADKNEVLFFDIDIDTAIALAQTLQEKSNEANVKQPSRKTFKRSHPFWHDRIKHFESLRPEVELKKAHAKETTVFNWQALADEYKKALKQ